MPDPGYCRRKRRFPGIPSGGLCAPDMAVNQEVKAFDARIQKQSIRRKQLRRREAPWEGSWSQNGEPTNRNVL